MTPTEMHRFFGMSRNTIYHWKRKDKDEGRYLLYRVLQRIPGEFIEETRRVIAEEEKLSFKKTAN